MKKQNVLSDLPEDPEQRKRIPITTGVLDYFPLAIAEVAKISLHGNDQHNPGEPLHWDRSKSTDHANCISRHLIQRGTFDEKGIRHSGYLAWRALALLQTEIEEELGFYPGDQPQAALEGTTLRGASSPSYEDEEASKVIPIDTAKEVSPEVLFGYAGDKAYLESYLETSPYPGNRFTDYTEFEHNKDKDDNTEQIYNTECPTKPSTLNKIKKLLRRE